MQHTSLARLQRIAGPDEDPQFETGAVCGRRPEGLASLASGASVGLAAYFAEVAHLEAASVVAFRRLEQDLRALDAPLDLVTRARRSRSDEIRHARETSELARRFGAIVPPVVVEEPGPRDAFAIALENAVEGCVRETYGAAVALFQAERAAPELRPILQRIAIDEARHAELAHDVASWLEPRLDPSERAKLVNARSVAFAELAFAVAAEPAGDVQRIAGMPSAREAALLLAALAQDLAV